MVLTLADWIKYERTEAWSSSTGSLSISLHTNSDNWDQRRNTQGQFTEQMYLMMSRESYVSRQLQEPDNVGHQMVVRIISPAKT